MRIEGENDGIKAYERVCVCVCVCVCVFVFCVVCERVHAREGIP